MPRTAATARRQTDQRASTRGSDTRSGELARTPVLFRLPTIELDLQSATRIGQEERVAVEPERDAVSLDDSQRAISRQRSSVVSPQADESIDQPPTSHSASADQASPVGEPPMLVMSDEELRGRGHSSIQSPQREVIEKNEPAHEQSMVTQRTENQSSDSLSSDAYNLPQSSDEPERSWWDHWSSGVVLILLVIALIAAGVIAFNDKAEGDADLLVQQQATSNEFDLGSIEIPDVKEAMPAEVVSTPSAESSQVAGASTSSAVEDVSLTEMPAQATSNGNTDPGPLATGVERPVADEVATSTTQTPAPTGLIPQSMEALSKPTLVDSEAAMGGETEAILLEPKVSDSSNLAKKQPGQSSGEALSLDPPAVESELMQPVAEEQPSLFPDLPLPSYSADNATNNGVSMLETQSAPNSQNSSGSTDSRGGMVSTNLPAYGELLSTSQPTSGQTVSGNSQQATFSTAGLQNKEGTQAGSESNQQSGSAVDGNTRPIPTATPNQDPDAIIRAYQHYIQMTESASQPNRYAAPPQQP